MMLPRECRTTVRVVADLDLDGIRLGGGRGLETWEETAVRLWPPS